MASTERYQRQKNVLRRENLTNRNGIQSSSECRGKKFSLEQAKKARRGSTCIALLSFNLGDGWLWVVNATPRPPYPGK
jgi:hypothetical protein